MSQVIPARHELVLMFPPSSSWDSVPYPMKRYRGALTTIADIPFGSMQKARIVHLCVRRNMEAAIHDGAGNRAARREVIIITDQLQRIRLARGYHATLSAVTYWADTPRPTPQSARPLLINPHGDIESSEPSL